LFVQDLWLMLFAAAAAHAPMQTCCKQPSWVQKVVCTFVHVTSHHCFSATEIAAEAGTTAHFWHSPAQHLGYFKN
jgi:hypothetical protein